jgi:hypothetical protein
VSFLDYFILANGISSDKNSITFASIGGSTHTFPFITLEKKKLTLGASNGSNIAEHYFEQK